MGTRALELGDPGVEPVDQSFQPPAFTGAGGAARVVALRCDTTASRYAQFCSTLSENAASTGIDSQVVEQFVEYMNANDMTPIETIRQMAEVATELPTLYRELAATTARESTNGPADGDQNATDTYDESIWNAFPA